MNHNIHIVGQGVLEQADQFIGLCLTTTHRLIQDFSITLNIQELKLMNFPEGVVRLWEITRRITDLDQHGVGARVTMSTTANIRQ
jgi:hypothetical protein